MHDPGAMRLVEALAYLDRILDGALDRRRAEAREQRPEVLPLEVLHDHVRSA